MQILRFKTAHYQALHDVLAHGASRNRRIVYANVPVGLINTLSTSWVGN